MPIRVSLAASDDVVGAVQDRLVEEEGWDREDEGAEEPGPHDPRGSLLRLGWGEQHLTGGSGVVPPKPGRRCHSAPDPYRGSFPEKRRRAAEHHVRTFRSWEGIVGETRRAVPGAQEISHTSSARVAREPTTVAKMARPRPCVPWFDARHSTQAERDRAERPYDDGQQRHVSRHDRLPRPPHRQQPVRHVRRTPVSGRRRGDRDLPETARRGGVAVRLSRGRSVLQLRGGDGRRVPGGLVCRHRCSGDLGRAAASGAEASPGRRWQIRIWCSTSIAPRSAPSTARIGTSRGVLRRRSARRRPACVAAAPVDG